MVVLVVVFDGVQSLGWGHAVATLLVVDGFSGGTAVHVHDMHPDAFVGTLCRIPKS